MGWRIDDPAKEVVNAEFPHSGSTESKMAQKT